MIEMIRESSSSESFVHSSLRFRPNVVTVAWLKLYDIVICTVRHKKGAPRKSFSFDQESNNVNEMWGIYS